jgi:hypothetical protein
MYGVDYSLPPAMLPPGFLADARNILPTSSGLPRGRSGSVKLNSTALASPITSLHEFRSGVTTRNLLASYGTKVAYYDSGTGEFVDSITGLTTGKMLQWVNFAGKAICVNEGTDAPQYWTDSSTKGALGGSPPVGRTIAEWSNRLWFGGDSTNVATLTGSCLNDPTDYTTSGATGKFTGIVGNSKDPITGIFGYFDMLMVGKQNMLYKVVASTGYPTTNAENLEIHPVYTKDDDSTGFTSPWAITQVGNDVIYLDGYDIKQLSGIEQYGDVNTASISPHFSDYLKSVAHKDYLKYTRFFHYKKAQQIWVSIPASATTHYLFVLDYQFKTTTGRYSFFPMYGLEITSFAGVEDGSIQNIYAGFEDGWVRQLDTGNDDDGAAIDRYFVTLTSGNKIGSTQEYSILNKQETRKQFHAVETFIKPDGTLSMTPSYAVDLLDDTQIRTSGNYTSLTAETVSSWKGTGTKKKRIRLFGVSGKTLAMKWRHNTLAQNFTFYPSEVHYEEKSNNEFY